MKTIISFIKLHGFLLLLVVVLSLASASEFALVCSSEDSPGLHSSGIVIVARGAENVLQYRTTPLNNDTGLSNFPVAGGEPSTKNDPDPSANLSRPGIRRIGPIDYLIKILVKQD